MAEEKFSGFFDFPLVPIPLRKLRVRFRGVAQNDRFGVILFRGLKGRSSTKVPSKAEAKTHLDTRRRAGCLSFFAVRGGTGREPAT
jgi:hypothetical protein